MRYRRVRRNHSTACPAGVVVWDTETEPVSLEGGLQWHRLRLGVARYYRREGGRRTREDELVFDQADQFWEWLDRKATPKRPVWAWAHNVGFDLRAVGLKRVVREGFLRFRRVDRRYGKTRTRRGCFVDGDPPTIVGGFLPGGGRVTFVDSFNFFRCSLRELGQWIGLEKGEWSHAARSAGTLADYCRGDVEILGGVVDRLGSWIADLHLGRHRHTAPSQSRSAWRHRFYTHPVVTHDQSDTRRLERRAYYSGRAQVLAEGKVAGPVHELDVCGAYVSVLRDERFPTKLLDTGEGAVGSRCPPLTRPLECCADVRLRGGDAYPYRGESRRVAWSADGGWTSLAGPELGRAVSAGAVREVGAWSYYRLEPAFGDFADWCWEHRRSCERDGDRVGAGLAKLIGNSFYGKWGQWSSRWIREPRLQITAAPFEPVYASTEEEPLITLRRVGDEVQRLVQRDEHPQAFPAIAAWCTAYLRERMRIFAECAGWQNVHYIVTDALYVNEAGRRRLWAAGWIKDRELGFLELRRTASQAEFLRPYHHTMDGQRTAAGIKSTDRELGGGWVEGMRFSSLPAGLSHPNIDDGVIVRPVRLRLPGSEPRPSDGRKYDKQRSF